MVTTIFVATLIAAPNTNTLPPCPNDEPATYKCVWDARHQGNGKGKSFISGPKGKIKYISHYRAHRLLFGTKSNNG